MKNKKDEQITVFLTNLQLHSNKANNPLPFNRKIEKSIKSGKEGRYFGGEMTLIEDNRFKITIDLPNKMKGKKIQIAIPEEGLYIYPGKDLKEKIKSLKKKRII